MTAKTKKPVRAAARQKPSKKVAGKKATARLNSTEASIMQSLSEAVQWAEGARVQGARVRKVNVPDMPDMPDVKAIRKKLGMSQDEFANSFGFSPSTLRNWEQGTRKPETTARILLTMIDRAPKVVEGILQG